MSYTSRNNNGRFYSAVNQRSSSYRCNVYHPGDRQPLSFPKEKLESQVHCVREFWDQKQLYYFLTWSSKMQLIDEQFKHYRLFNTRNLSEVIIFNAELHDIASNAELFVVGMPTPAQSKGARFEMSGFMDAQTIEQEFGIASADLPIGSRRKHNYFTNERYHLSPAAQHITIRDFSSLHLERPQQYKKDKEVLPSAITHNVAALNQAIAAALQQIKNGSLSLIRTLRIDRKRGQIECVPLIPIKVPSVKQWMAVSFRERSHGYRGQRQQLLEITSLYTNCYDVVSKAALVSPNNVYALHWLTGDKPGSAGISAQNQEQLEAKSEELARTRDQLSESFQAQDQLRLRNQELQQQVSQQLRSYMLMLSMLQQKEKEIAELKCNMQQSVPQAYVAIQVPLPATPPNSLPIFQGITSSTPLTTPQASPSPQFGPNGSNGPNSYMSPATSPSPALMMPRLRLMDFGSGSSCSSTSSVSSDLELSCEPLTQTTQQALNSLNQKAPEFVPEKVSKLMSLPPVLEQQSLKFEDTYQKYQMQ